MSEMSSLISWCSLGSGSVHAVSLYSGSVPRVLWSNEVNFGLLSEFRPPRSSENGNSSDFADLRMVLGDIVPEGRLYV